MSVMPAPRPLAPLIGAAETDFEPTKPSSGSRTVAAAAAAAAAAQQPNKGGGDDTMRAQYDILSKHWQDANDELGRTLISNLILLQAIDTLQIELYKAQNQPEPSDDARYAEAVDRIAAAKAALKVEEYKV